MALLHRPARPIQLLAPKLAPENLTSPKRKRRPVLLLFLRLDELRRAERLGELICPEEFMDGLMDGWMRACTCVLTYVCWIRLCHGTLICRPLTAEFSVRGQSIKKPNFFFCLIYCFTYKLIKLLSFKVLPSTLETPLPTFSPVLERVLERVLRDGAKVPIEFSSVSTVSNRRPFSEDFNFGAKSGGQGGWGTTVV